MPLFFKIFLFLFFNRGLNGTKYNQYEVPIQSLQVVSILVLQGDQSSLEQAICNCLMVYPIVDVVREPNNEGEIFMARLQYKNLLFSARQQLEQQLHPYKDKINIQWFDTTLK